ncbi:CHAT domain-containing protein [Pseudofulvibacter geojedonensis]|uniref:CHAT domain-containing protein n=1 Tax=Pseudofulvibacter geojedonensis TaxID=1123758 RepID=A0ABW3I4M7_9FLAO
MIYHEKKDFKKSLASHKKALFHTQKISNTNPLSITEKNNHIIKALIYDSQLNQAKTQLDQVKNIVFSGKNNYDLKNTKNDILVEEYLTNSILYHKKKSLIEKKDQHLDSIKYYYKQLDFFHDKLQERTLNNKSNQILAEIGYSFYERYINDLENIFDSNNQQKSFELAEKNKSRRLLEKINIQNTSFKKIPDSLFKEEKNIVNQIISNETKKNTAHDSLKSKISDKIFELKREQEKLEKLFKHKYPEYHQLKYDTKISSIKDIQSKLSTNQSLLEYFVGDENIFIFAITKDIYIVKQLKKDFPLKEWVENLRNGIYSYWNNKKGDLDEYNKLYRKNAFNLYHKLINPIKNLLTEEVIIVPDAELNFIPFDALLTDKNDDKSYLIKDYQISYNYSATHYLQLLNGKQKKTTKSILAVAPSFNKKAFDYESLLAKRSDLSNLEYNIPEAKSVSALFNGTLLESNHATKENFLKQAKNFNIIHLSTHAKSNDAMGEFSYIAFQKETDSTSINDSRLYVNELYNLDLNADLVVLSACETGLGELKRGEGVISLARGFTYAGAKSTITSLWSVNDAQTTKLMESFYTNLKEGMTKDKALRQAKLDYLNNENLNAPYFWAGFIPAGDMSVISSNTNYWCWIVGIIILVMFFIFNRKRSKKLR